MKEMYGTKGYYQHEADKTALEEALIREAIAERIAKGNIKADELGTYAEVLERAEIGKKYAEEKLAEIEASEKLESETTDTVEVEAEEVSE